MGVEQHPVRAPGVVEPGQQLQLPQGFVQGVGHGREELAQADRDLDLRDPGTRRRDHRAELARVADHHVRVPFPGDVDQRGQSRLGVQATEDLSDDDPVRLLAGQRRQTAEDGAHLLGRHIGERQVVQTGVRHVGGEAVRRRDGHLVAGGLAGLRDRDHRAEVAGPGRRTEQHPHPVIEARPDRLCRVSAQPGGIQALESEPPALT